MTRSGEPPSLTPGQPPPPPGQTPPLAGVQFDQNDLSVRLGDIKLMEAGQPLPFDNGVRALGAGATPGSCAARA
jgi:hypothetical protein